MDKTHHQGIRRKEMPSQIFTKFVVSGEVVYAAADGGLFRSTNMGNS